VTATTDVAGDGGDEADDAPHEARMTIFEHLAELRSRIIRSALAVLAGAVLCWILYPWILEVLLEPYCTSVANIDAESGCQLLAIDPLDPLKTRISISLYGGIALAMPVLLWQIWRFIMPGLYPNERKLAVPFVTSALTLFVMGAALAYYTLPKALEFLQTIGGGDINNAYSPSKYLSLITYMMLAFGIGFEFPIILVFLQMVGVVTPQKLASWRRFAIVGIVVLVAVITPSGDPYSLALLSVPMYIFYEGAIVIGRLMARRKRAREAADEPASS
jgi:sec-independent protein translocase protein TatC